VPYVTQTWVDGVGGGTPVNAARLAHIEAGLGEHETRVAALEFDTGWITVTIRTGFAAVAGVEALAVRQRGKLIKMRGGIANTGVAAANTSYTVADVPGAIPAPPIPLNYPVGSSAGAAVATLLLGTDRSIILRTSGTLGTYYKFDAVNWFID
jgi:hypothetical protein